MIRVPYRGLRHRLHRLELLETRLQLAVTALDAEAFTDEPVLEFEGPYVYGSPLVLLEQIQGETVTVTVNNYADRSESNTGVPTFSGSSLFTTDGVPVSFEVDFPWPTSRIGFDYGTFDEFVSGGVTVQVFNAQGSELGAVHFTPTLPYDVVCYYDFAGISSDEPFVRAVVTSNMRYRYEFDDFVQTGYEIIVDNLRVGKAATVREFTNASNISELQVDFSGIAPTSVAFYKSADGVFSKNQDALILQKNLLSSDLVDIPNGKRLKLNPAGGDFAALQSVLENEGVATIFAVADPGIDHPSSAPFRGFYRAANSELAVVRPGPDTADTVAIGPGTLSFSAEREDDEGNPMVVKSASRMVSGVKSVLIVTTELDDIVSVEAGATGKLIVNSGAGADELDFSQFVSSAGITVNLAEASDQALAAGLSLDLFSDSIMENVTGSPQADRIFGNASDNLIAGEGGNDVIVGQEGTDGLHGGADNDAVLGDGFELSSSAWGTVAASFDTFLENLTLEFGMALVPLAAGAKDFIYGDDGTDLLMGGAGDDEIFGGAGWELIFGDAFSIESEYSFNLAANNLDVATSFFSPFKALLEGDGADTINTEDGGSIVIGGGGNDPITGGNDAIDALFGNEGADEIDGLNGVNFIVGGDEGDTKLKGGTGLDFILGDDFSFGGTFPSVTSFGTPAEAIQALVKLFGGFTSSGEGGEGKDTIDTGDGWNLAIGGAQDDNVTGGAGVDLLYGEAGVDVIKGLGGVDMIVGGADGDFLYGEDIASFGGSSASTNLIFGDIVVIEVDFDVSSLLAGSIEMAFPGVDIGLSGTGDDTIHGGDGTDLLVGGNGMDKIYGHDGFNVAFGDDFSIGPIGTAFGFFVDLLNPMSSITASIVEATVEAAWDYFAGSEGNAGDVRDMYFGGSAVDIAFGGGGNDELHGGDGFDLLVGGEGDDDFIDAGDGGSEIDIEFLFGLIHIDSIGFGGAGNDSFQGGGGNNYFGSTEGDDLFRGGGGQDVLSGGAGNDMLFGDDGDDVIIGGDDDDVIYGGPGVDSIDGGGGANTIVEDGEPLPGDFDFDGDADGGDFLIWQRQLGAAGVARTADGDGNAVVGAGDLATWRVGFGGGVLAEGAPTLREAINPPDAMASETADRDLLFARVDLTALFSARDEFPWWKGRRRRP